MNAPILQIGKEFIQAEEIPFLLKRYQVMSQVLRGMVIDQAIAPITCTESERQAAIAEFCQQHQLISVEAQAAWLGSQGLTLTQLEELALRPLKIEKFKAATWGNKVNSYFLMRKASLNQVVYSLIRTTNLELANELYFRISEGEQSFADLARQHSQGPEAHTGGLLGPVSLSQPHPAIGKLLSVSQPGQLWKPRPLAEWFVIIRLEKLIPTQLDESMRQRLLDELFEQWLDTQIKQAERLPEQEQLAA